MDFAAADVFERMTQDYVDACETFTPSLDLLIIDESQDFERIWANAVTQKLKSTGKLYVMGDSGHQLGFNTKRFSGYDASGNALWTDGALLVESVYRFKGQSMPVVVLCEVDFEELTDKEKQKLFMGLTRGQVRVDVAAKVACVELLMNGS